MKINPVYFTLRKFKFFTINTHDLVFISEVCSSFQFIWLSYIFFLFTNLSSLYYLNIFSFLCLFKAYIFLEVISCRIFFFFFFFHFLQDYFHRLNLIFFYILMYSFIFSFVFFSHSFFVFSLSNISIIFFSLSALPSSFFILNFLVLKPNSLFDILYFISFPFTTSFLHHIFHSTSYSYFL